MAVLLVLWARLADDRTANLALLTAYAPLFWVCLYVRRRTIAGAVLATPALLFLAFKTNLALPFWPCTAIPIQQLSELVSFSWTALLALHIAYKLGSWGVARYLITAGIYGLSLESSGIQMGFFTEPGYSFYFPFLDTPLVAVTGWITVFYPVMFLIRELQTRWPTLLSYPTLSGILCGLAALSIDLHLDPIATNLKLWIWNPRLTPFFQGVPLLNFTSWFFAVATFSSACFWLDRLIQSRAKREGILLVAIPGIQALAGLFNFAMVALIEGSQSPGLILLREHIGRVL
ncbi:MAG: carotenoid biosynthesis protein [Leptospirales bacterium]|nr:carotenoid biosynthesis protein [Leptospirales bacterium]